MAPAKHAKPKEKTKQNNRHLMSKQYGKIPKKQHEPLQAITEPHKESFNQMLHNLEKTVQSINPVEFELCDHRVSFRIVEAFISRPILPEAELKRAAVPEIYPTECRQAHTSYKGNLNITLAWKVDGDDMPIIQRDMGQVPIMVKTQACNLFQKNPKQLVRHGEEPEEMGGYFIINGIERVVRMLIMPRRNFPASFKRNAWKNRGTNYTEYGVSMRCVDESENSVDMVLHYLEGGTVQIACRLIKEQFFINAMVILQALTNTRPADIMKSLTEGKRHTDAHFDRSVNKMLREMQELGVTNQREALEKLGKVFRIKFDRNCPEWWTDVQFGQHLIQKAVCIHLPNYEDKFNMISFMLWKLFSFKAGNCSEESPDNPAFHEVLMAGHLYQKVLKESLEVWLRSLKFNLKKKASSDSKGPTFDLNIGKVTAATKGCPKIGPYLESLISTGNLPGSFDTPLGLMQVKGLTVVAEKLNFHRYISHFRAVHRGAFFTEMRTTTARKLLPEASGFMCPVHTPDGSPCGLLNHLAAMCKITATRLPNAHARLAPTLKQLGMEPWGTTAWEDEGEEKRAAVPVILDGQTMGWVTHDNLKFFVDQLRLLKGEDINDPRATMEMAVVPPTKTHSQYPAIYIFTTPARFTRPVINIALNKKEWIGTFEQAYMDIAVDDGEIIPGVHTHKEVNESAMLSTIACLTPFSDHNQSPRSIYQCQMGKQTMGWPCHTMSRRGDNKMFCLATPQSPLCRTRAYDELHMDDYPLGTNAVIAVISYTGYDMEDAMIINRGSFQRGFGHGSIYKTEVIDLNQQSDQLEFAAPPEGERPEHIEEDGLPRKDAYLQTGDPYYSYQNKQTGELSIKIYKYQEAAYVSQVTLLTHEGKDGTEGLNKVAIQLRIPRPPVIGDKFASRHGQKGILSVLMPQEDMPFTDGGMVPDILFNPHGFPSRMTIGMFIEIMAGKAAAMHGTVEDATPFNFNEENSAIEHYMEKLQKAGYEHMGNEVMYSGINGKMMEVEIFMGVCYYQRLRHMVSDKYQVRTTGAYDQLTRQPVKGRKKGGGVRFGEMERDGLLSHGASFVVQDRLLNSSDRTLAYVCTVCGSLISPMSSRKRRQRSWQDKCAREWQPSMVCMMCPNGGKISQVAIPYVFRYLVVEFAAMNLQMTLETKL